MKKLLIASLLILSIGMISCSEKYECSSCEVASDEGSTVTASNKTAAAIECVDKGCSNTD